MWLSEISSSFKLLLSGWINHECEKKKDLINAILDPSVGATEAIEM